MSKSNGNYDALGIVIALIIIIGIIIILGAFSIIVLLIIGIVALTVYLVKQSSINKLKNEIKIIFNKAFDDLKIKPKKEIDIEEIEETLNIEDKHKRTKAAVILSENENIELGLDKFEKEINKFFDYNEDLLNKNYTNASSIQKLNEDFNNTVNDLKHKFAKNKLKYDVQLECYIKLLQILYSYKESLIDLMKYVNQKGTANLTGIYFNEKKKGDPIIMGPFDFWGNDKKEKEDKDDELEKKMKNYNLEEWEKEEVRKGHQDITSFEEDDTDDDDDYYGED